jgi:polyisoprenyl-phosphate glycosyltransferase
MKKLNISVITAVYMAEAIVEPLVNKLTKELDKITNSYEIILVEDCSTDNSWKEIEKLCNQNKKLIGIKLSRNFGQHIAITAGLEKSRGENIVFMDCDLQDNPENISKLLNKKNEGFEIVFTRRKKRKHGLIKKSFSFFYNKLFKLFSDENFDINTGSLVLFSMKVKNSFLSVKDKERLYIQILKWTGFSSTYLEVDHEKRHSGRSSYTSFKIIKLGIQGWVFNSNKLLHLNIYFGLIISLLSLISLLTLLFLRFFFHFLIGWPSLIAVILMSSGIIMVNIGVLGIYIGKIFKEIKNRPLYIIEKEINN